MPMRKLTLLPRGNLSYQAVLGSEERGYDIDSPSNLVSRGGGDVVLNIWRCRVNFVSYPHSETAR